MCPYGNSVNKLQYQSYRVYGCCPRPCAFFVKGRKSQLGRNLLLKKIVYTFCPSPIYKKYFFLFKKKGNTLATIYSRKTVMYLIIICAFWIICLQVSHMQDFMTFTNFAVPKNFHILVKRC